MTRRRFQYSLASLLGIVTLCAVLLSAWFTRPPRLHVKSFDGHAFYEGTGSQYREWAAYTITSADLWTPRGRQQVRLICLYFAPSFARLKFIAHGCRPQLNECQVEIYSDIGVIQDAHTVDRKLEVSVCYDARKQTVSLGDETVRYLPDHVYVVEVDDLWQPHLIQDDRSLRSIKVSPAKHQQLVSLVKTLSATTTD